MGNAHKDANVTDAKKSAWQNSIHKKISVTGAEPDEEKKFAKKLLYFKFIRIQIDLKR